MAEIIRMPKMSDTMEEGVIAAWLKKVGDAVKPGDILAEVETDKATMELESYEEGVLLYVGVEEKNAVAVNGVIAIIGEKGENIDALLKDIEGGDAPAPKAEEKKEEKAEAPKEEKAPAKEEKSEAPKAESPKENIDTSGINATVLTMPKMSDTMTEGTIASWLKKVGDTIKSGDIIAEVETDKATMELESYDDGVLLYIGVEEGNAVEVDGVIAIVGEKGADYEKLLKAHKAKSGGAEAPASEEKKEEKPAATETKAPETKPSESKPAETSAPAQSTSSENGRIIASPLAKKMASDKGIDISLVKGSGEGGRIIKRDVESFDPASVKPAASQATAAPSAAASGPAIGSGIFQGREGFTDEKSHCKEIGRKQVWSSAFLPYHGNQHGQGHRSKTKHE
jgi:pyruvate dehydrogenase E2 component (dihydrolipoamide acetyltransferase)